MKTIQIANIIHNDVLNGEGICTSIWLQGCPHKCYGCHNQSTWDFNGGTTYYQEDIIKEIIYLLQTNGIKRNLSILGGEPLCSENIEFVRKLAAAVKAVYPDIVIFCWTGYTLEELKEKYNIDIILNDIDVLIDGRFEQDKRDITLKLRGSSNQHILLGGVDY